MAVFQTLPSIQSELYLLLEEKEEQIDYISVNVFEWVDRFDGDSLCYDVEINAYDENGNRVDNWVTDIVYNKIAARRRLKAVEKSVNKFWFSKREEKVLNGLGFYSTREQLKELVHDSNKNTVN